VIVDNELLDFHMKNNSIDQTPNLCLEFHSYFIIVQLIRKSLNLTPASGHEAQTMRFGYVIDRPVMAGDVS
jgi:hypothetical protein